MGKKKGLVSAKVLPEAVLPSMHITLSGENNANGSHHHARHSVKGFVTSLNPHDHCRRYHYYSYFAVEETEALRGEAIGPRVGFELRHAAVSHYATSPWLPTIKSGTALKTLPSSLEGPSSHTLGLEMYWG